jgi:HEAT repeat protein
MTFNLEKYEEAIISQDDARRIKAGLELAEIIPTIPQEELEKSSQQIVHLLLEALRNNDWEYRSLISNALLTLGKLDFIAKSTWFWKKLISTYTDADSGLRSSAMDLLKELGRSEYSLEILEPLIDGLHSQNKDMRILSASTLGKIRAKEVVPMLIQALDDDNANVVYNVVECLGDIGDRSSVPALMQLLLKYHDEWVHVAALEALGKIGDQRVVDLLLSFVNKEFVVDPLITALGVLGDSRAIPTLITYLKDDDQDIRELAVKALVTIWEEVEYGAELTGVQYELDATRKILEQSMTANVKNTILNDMKDTSVPEAVREDCAVLLSCVEYPKALVPIVQLLEVSPLSKKIIYAVGQYGKRAFSHLLPLLEHSDFRVRQSVGLYLQNLVRRLENFDSQVEHALLRLTRDENPVLNQIALESLGMMKSTTMLPSLIKILQSDPHTFGDTITAILSRFPKRSVYNAISNTIQEEDEKTLPYYIKILGYTGTQIEYFKKFFKHPDPHVQGASIRAVGLTGNPKGVPLLLPFIMSRQHSPIRCAAALSLDHLITTLGVKLPKPRNVFNALFVMLNTYKNEEELSAVAQALGTLCRNRYEEITDLNVAVVRGRLFDLLPGVSNDTRVHILESLQGIVDKSSFAVVRELRKINSLEVQKTVATLYGQFDKDLRVIADVADMISHSEFSVRKCWILTAGKLCAVELTDLLVPLLADPDFRIEAFQALTMMGAEVVPCLSGWLHHEDPRIKKMTALVLSRISQDCIDKFCTIPQNQK